MLTVTQMLRKKGVVDKFVEFYGPGLSALALADRATIANMAPEYGATMGFFPVDAETVRYLERTGRGRGGMRAGRAILPRSRDSSAPTRRPTRSSPRRSSSTSTPSTPSLAGPKRPQDLVPLTALKRNFIVNLPGLMSASVPTARKELAESAYSRWMGEGGGNVTIDDHGEAEHMSAVAAADPDAPPVVSGQLDGADITLHDGAVVIAAITSCTNTSNPSVMIGAGLRGQEGGGARAHDQSRGSRPAWPPAPAS